MNKIAPCLWFDSQAEDAARFYVSVFKNATIKNISRYGDAAAKAAGRPRGSVLTVEFELDGQQFTALNGGPIFKISEAVSFMVNCENQDELDYYWNKLSEGGPVDAQQCGWLKDKFGVSWQIVPSNIAEMVSKGDPVKLERMWGALLQMKKLDMAALQRAYDGK